MPIPYEKLGALERPKDERDFPLGATLVPGPRPKTGDVDLSWLKRNYQAQLPFCGPHALSHNKAIQDHDAGYATMPWYTPRFTSVRMKDPKSPVYDGFAPDAGTTLRALFKAAKVAGANVFMPLQNDTSLSIQDYLNPLAVTDAMVQDAGTRLISSYAFEDTPTYEVLASAIFQWKSVVILIKCDEGFWGTNTPTFTNPKYGHFIDGYDWDDNRGGVWIIDSAEPQEQYAKKFIAEEYIVPQFFFESGTTVDLPPSVHQALSQGDITTAKDILSKMKQILELDTEWLKKKVGISQNK